jgi:ribosomal protein S18 acetylase RimI-like enzyme
VRIRAAGVADAPAIGRISVETWRAAYAGIVPAAYLAGLSSAACAAEWHDILVTPAGAHFVLVAGHAQQDPIAFAGAGPERSGDPRYRGELYAIYVLPSHQGRGVGRALVRAAADRLAAAGLDSLLVWVLDQNAPARAFYERLGGSVVRRQPIEIGGAGLTEVAYGWPTLQALRGRTDRITR